MKSNKKRRVAAGGTGKASDGAESIARWGELPLEIVAMIASYTCTPVEPLPFTSLAHSADPDSCAYHRQEDRTFAFPGGQFAREVPQPPELRLGSDSMATTGGDASQSPGPGRAQGPGTDGGSGAGGVGGAQCAGGEDGPPVAVPGTFRPSRISDTALAMRGVCRLWCEVLSEGVRRVLLQDAQPYTIWASHFPRISHLALGTCSDLLVRTADRDGGGGDQAGAGPSSIAAAAAAGSGSRRSSRHSRRDGSDGGGCGGASAGGSGAGGVSKSRSLAPLTALRNLQVTDTAVHLDLAASCPSLEELVVCAQNHEHKTDHNGRELPFPFGPGSGLMSGAGRRAGGGGGGAAARTGPPAVSRRSALDRTLSSLPGLRRLRLSGIDASAARLGSAMMALGALTSLRLHQCRLPTFFGAPGKGRSSQSAFGRDLVLNLGTKLRDLSLQGCCLRVLPPEVAAGLTGLRMLDLSANWLSALPETITTMVQLEYLDLQHNTLSSLPEGLSALSRLADLDLSGNHLHRLPTDFGALTGLTHLHLGGLHGLDMGFCCSLLTPLTNLCSLGLCDVDLSIDTNFFGDGNGGVGEQAGQGPLEALVSALAPVGRLRELLLDGCGLDKLPGNFSELTSLSHLSIMENFDASGLPDGVTALTGLAILRLGYLDLSGPLPPSLFDLVELRELDMEQNFLPCLPSYINKLSNLQILNLVDAFDPDTTSVIPWPDVYSLTKLRQLSITGQEDSDHVQQGIGALTALEVLQLRSMPMPPAVLDELCTHVQGLTSLDLTSSSITALPTAITKLVRLTELQLCYNNLSRLPNGIGALTRLTELGLKNNRSLRSLPDGITRLCRLRCLGWSVSLATTATPSPQQLAWLAKLPDLSLYGSCKFAELAKAQNIPWPNRHSYL